MPDEVSQVYIYTHGSERMFQFADGSSYNALTVDGKNKAQSEEVAGSLKDLDEKTIDQLYINACNTGHIDALNDNSKGIDNTNPAKILSEKIDGTVHAWDGSVSFDIFTKEPRLSNSQNHFNIELIQEKGYPQREPIGEVIYQNGNYIRK